MFVLFGLDILTVQQHIVYSDCVKKSVDTFNMEKAVVIKENKAIKDSNYLFRMFCTHHRINVKIEEHFTIHNTH